MGKSGCGCVGFVGFFLEREIERVDDREIKEPPEKSWALKSTYEIIKKTP